MILFKRPQHQQAAFLWFRSTAALCTQGEDMFIHFITLLYSFFLLAYVHNLEVLQEPKQIISYKPISEEQEGKHQRY